MKNIILATLLAAAAVPLSINAASITSYDIDNATASGTGGWNHTYSGTITPTLGNLRDYSNGSGTLNDGIFPTSVANNQLWFSNTDNGDTNITLFLDNAYTLSNVQLFGAGGTISNSIPGTLFSVDVTIQGITETFATAAFGPGTNSNSMLVNDLIDFSGSVLSTLVTTSLTLSNFKSNWDNSNTFNLAEVVVNENVNVSAVPIPAAAFLFAPALLGFMGLRRKAKTA